MHIDAKEVSKAEDDQERNKQKIFKMLSYLLVIGSVSEFGKIIYI